MAVPFVHDKDTRYGEPVPVSSLIRRVTAHNPGPYTYTGTGTYIIGHDTVAVIDPGPLLADHITALMRALEGETVSHILITHTHIDHSPAARILAEKTGAKIYAFAPHGLNPELTGYSAQVDEGSDRDFSPDCLLGDGETMTGPGWTIEAVHTPGHTSSHLCYALKEEKALFTGDHIMGWATSVIAPPDGNMASYLESLRKLLTRDETILYPTHGPPVEKPKSFIRALITHRKMRTGQILRILDDAPSTIGEIVGRLYANIPENLHKAAACSVLAHLIDLKDQGRITFNDPADEQTVFSRVAG